MKLIGWFMIVAGLAFAAILSLSPMSGGLEVLGLVPPLAVGGLMVLAGVLALRRGTHAAFVLMTLDLVGLTIAVYLSSVELQGQIPNCGVLHGCEQVALSEYARVGGIPVAVFGVKSPTPIGPDLSTAADDAERRFSLPIDVFVRNPVGTMRAVFARQFMLSPAQKDEAIRQLRAAFAQYEALRAAGRKPLEVAR